MTKQPFDNTHTKFNKKKHYHFYTDNKTLENEKNTSNKMRLSKKIKANKTRHCFGRFVSKLHFIVKISLKIYIIPKTITLKHNRQPKHKFNKMQLLSIKSIDYLSKQKNKKAKH